MASSNPHLVARRIEDHYSDEEIHEYLHPSQMPASMSDGLASASLGNAATRVILAHTHHQIDHVDLYNKAIQATRVEHHQDAQGLPIKVLYYSYQDLWQLDELVENGHAQSWLDVYFHPACQLQLSTGQLPTQTPFPGSKGYVDLAINWLYSWLPSGQSDKTVRFNEQHWLGDTIIIGDIHDKIKRK